jgi:restriction system protein
MALWLVRAGSHGEYEKRFLEDNKIYLTWEGINTDLSKFTSKENLRDYLGKTFPDSSKGKITNHTSQIGTFISKIKAGDWIVLPSKHKSAIHIAEVISGINYDGNVEDIYRHYYQVNWFATDIPRTNFDQDILYSFGAFMTVCQIKRNDAEKRIQAMQKNNWHVTTQSVLQVNGDESAEGELIDLSQVARDQIAKLILAKFKGHGMTRLVNAILEAQGYTTHVSPEGPDKGVDILAAPGPM